MNLLVKCILVAGVIYLTLIVLAVFLSNRIIFPIPPASYEDLPNTLKLKTDKGAEITVMYLEAPESERLLLYSHGNAEDLGTIEERLQEFQAKGISVIAYDYPGYGTSSHKPNEAGVYAAVDAVYRYSTETLNFTPEQIALYGYSLGSGPACWLAEHYPVDRLILEGAYTSTFRVISRIRLLPFDKFDSLSRFETIDCPILLIHGTKDYIIHFWHAEKNWKSLRGEKQKLWVDGAGHTNLPEVAGSVYWDTVTSFIQHEVTF